MSKRYGRNQKRKAKLEIESLKRECARLKFQSKHIDEAVYIANEIIDIAKKINPHSIVFKPYEIDKRCYQFHVDDAPKTLYAVTDFIPNEVERLISFRTIDLYDFEATFESNLFKDAVDFKVALTSDYGKNIVYKQRLSIAAVSLKNIEDFSKEVAEKIIDECRIRVGLKVAA
jgi:hypothetical protein